MSTRQQALEEVAELMAIAEFPQYKPKDAKVAREVRDALVRLVRQHAVHPISGKLPKRQSRQNAVKART